MTMKYIIIHQVGSVYRDNNGVLEVAPLYKDNTFYEEEFGEVEDRSNIQKACTTSRYGFRR